MHIYLFFFEGIINASKNTQVSIFRNFLQIFFLTFRNLNLIKESMKFAETLSETVLKIKIKNSISDFDSKNSRNFEITAEFPSWGIRRPGELKIPKLDGQVLTYKKDRKKKSA